MPGFNIGGFPGQDGLPAADRETARRNRFILTILGPLSNQLLIVAHKCGRPAIEFDRVIVHHGQEEIYMPGKNRWQPIEVSFYETQAIAGGSDDAAAQIYDWWSHVVTSKRESRLRRDVKRNGNLDLVDGAARPMWRYRLYGVWPSKITPDTFDYSDSAISEINVTLSIDKCEEVALLPGVFSAKSSCDPPEKQPDVRPGEPIKPLIGIISAPPTPDRLLPVAPITNQDRDPGRFPRNGGN